MAIKMDDSFGFKLEWPYRKGVVRESPFPEKKSYMWQKTVMQIPEDMQRQV